MAYSIVQSAATAYNTDRRITPFTAYAHWAGNGFGTTPGDEATINFGASTFAHSPPSGFTAYDSSGSTTFDATHAGSQITLSGGNLTATAQGSAHDWDVVRATTSKTSGKWYWEVTIVLLHASFGQAIGVCSSAFTPFTTDPPGFGGGASNDGCSWQTGQSGFLNNGGVSGPNPGTYTTGDTICFALDMDRGYLWARNGAGNWNGSGTANPTTAVGGMDISFLSSVATAFTGPYTNWGSTPTNGNLLLVAGFNFNGSPGTFANGWTLGANATTGGFNQWWAYKYASSAAEIEQVLPSGDACFGCEFYEISGVTGTIATDVIKATLGGIVSRGTYTSAAPTLTTQSSTKLLLACFQGQSVATGNTFSGMSGFTADASVLSTTADPDQSEFDYSVGYHQTVTGSTLYSPTLTFGSNVANWGVVWFELPGGSSTETATVSMMLDGVYFSGGGSRLETGAVTFNLHAVNFSVAGVAAKSIAVILNLEGVSIEVQAFDVSAFTPGATLWTFG